MTDNMDVNDRALASQTIALDDIAGVKVQRVKATWGPDGTMNDVDVATGKPMPVQLRGSDGTDRSNSLPISVAAGLSNRAFSVAATTLTRPANTTPYTAGDSISDNATAGSVTALSASLSDTNDDPIFISDIRIDSTDTGLAGKKVRVNLFNADPTASSGVSGGDNAAYSQKKAGYVGTFVGTMESGFSDGTVGRLIPSFRDTNYTPAGGFVVVKPTSGAKTIFIQYVAEEAFTPSANSTTVIGNIRGWQGKAA